MKRELVELLGSDQDQTARIRVEYVIREEKMMAAYDLLDIYCDLIVARVPIVESQKNALLTLRKQLHAKYGKEFVYAAIKLQPNCGVCRLELISQEKAQASTTANEEVDLDELMDDSELEILHADRIASLKKLRNDKS